MSHCLSGRKKHPTQPDEHAQEYDAEADDSLLSTAGSLLGSFLGGRRSSTAMARQSRQRRTAARKRDTAADRVSTLQDDAAELEAELAADLQEIADAWDAKAADVTTMAVPLEKSDVAVTSLALAWVPVA